MPPVKLHYLISSQEEEILEHSISFKYNMIEAVLKYIGPNSTNMRYVPTKDDIFEASPDEPLVWYSVYSFIKIQ